MRAKSVVLDELPLHVQGILDRIGVFPGHLFYFSPTGRVRRTRTSGKTVVWAVLSDIERQWLRELGLLPGELYYMRKMSPRPSPLTLVREFDDALSCASRGAACRQLAEKYGRSVQTMRRWIRDAALLMAEGEAGS